MLFTYRGPLHRYAGVPTVFAATPRETHATASELSSDRTVARLRIDIHVVRGELVYDELSARRLHATLLHCFSEHDVVDRERAALSV